MSFSARELEIINHYAASLGKPNDLYRTEDIPPPAPKSIIVLEFAPLSDDYDWVYVTVGASNMPMRGTEDVELESQHRMELMIYSRQQQAELPDLLTNLAIYPFQLNTFLAPGHTIAGRPGVGVVTGSNLTEILLLPPIFKEPEFEYINHSDGTHTQILHVIPIYLSERIYAKEHGYYSLVGLFEENQTDTSDLQRPSVVP